MPKIKTPALVFASTALCIVFTAAQSSSNPAPAEQPDRQAAKVESVRQVGNRFFFLETPAGSPDGPSLMVREAGDANARKLLESSELSPPGKHAVIFDIEPSWNGRYVAVGASFNRSEVAFIRVIDVATSKLLKDSIPRSFDGDASWADDDRSFYYRQVQELPAGSPRAAAFENMRAYVHRLGDDPASDKPIFGPEFAPELHLPKQGAINAFPVPGTSLILAVQSGSPDELDSFWVKNPSAKNPAWKQIIDHKDEVIFNFALKGSRLYFVTTKHALNGRLMVLDIATQDISQAKEVFPQSDLVLSDRNEDGVAAASDSIYVYGSRNGTSVVLRVPNADPTAREEIKLPASGSIADLSADYRTPGFVFTLIGDKQRRTTYTYNPASKQFTDTHLQPQ